MRNEELQSWWSSDSILKLTIQAARDGRDDSPAGLTISGAGECDPTQAAETDVSGTWKWSVGAAQMAVSF